MKRVLRLMSFALAATVVLGLVGCGGGKAGKGEAYGVVHNNYVGIVQVETADNGKVSKVTFDEMETPHSWAKSSVIETGLTDADLVAPGGYAKRIQIGERIFDAKATEGAAYPDYQLSGNNTEVALLNWLKDTNNAKWYVEQMKGGNYWILTAEGDKVDAFKTAATGKLLKGERWLKSKNGYWQEGANMLGWKKNMTAIVNYITENGFADSGFAVRGEDKVWMVDDTSTGATLVDFNDYMVLARLAVFDAFNS